MNQIDNYRQTAKGVWPYLLPLFKSEICDMMRFYRATVVSNPGAGKLSVQREQGPVILLPCSSGLAEAQYGDAVLVMSLGTGQSLYEVALCAADPDSFAQTLVDVSRSDVERVVEDAVEDAKEEQEERWEESYGALYTLVMATAGELLPLQEGHVIDTVTVMYYLSTSRTECVDGQWQYSQPAPVEGRFLWTKLYVTYADGTDPTETNPVCAAGAGSWHVWSVEQMFYASTHGDQLLAWELDPGWWSSTAPVLADGEYLWTRQKVNYTLTPTTEDGTTLVGTSWSDPCCLSGVIGNVATQEIGSYKLMIDDEVYNISDLLVELKRGYVAKSEFGTYLQELVSHFKIDEEGAEQDFQFFSSLKAGINNLQAAFQKYTEATAGYVRTGIVDYESDNTPIFGVAVGQELVTSVDANGHTVIEKQHFRAVYTANRLAFWQDGVEVAHVSNNQLYITNIVAHDTVEIGNWRVSGANAASGLVFKWIGG